MEILLYWRSPRRSLRSSIFWIRYTVRCWYDYFINVFKIKNNDITRLPWEYGGVIFIYNTKILLPLTFDEQTDKKRYASTGNRTHDQDWFT